MSIQAQNSDQQKMSVVCTAKSMSFKFYFHPNTCSFACICTCHVSTFWMCAGVCAAECERVDVCQSSSVNIVLCSSNSSSSGSAVATRSNVYFPSWRTTSYQISRHCLRAAVQPCAPRGYPAHFHTSLCLFKMIDCNVNHSHHCQCQ